MATRIADEFSFIRQRLDEIEGKEIAARQEA